MKYKTRLEVLFDDGEIITTDDTNELKDDDIEMIDKEFSEFLNDRMVNFTHAKMVKLSIYVQCDKKSMVNTTEGEEETDKWQLKNVYYYDVNPHAFKISKTKVWYMKEKKEDGFTL